jgi:hypothetical protein
MACSHCQGGAAPDRTIERQYQQSGGSTVVRLEVARTASWNYRKLSEREWILPWAPGPAGTA